MVVVAGRPVDTARLSPSMALWRPEPPQPAARPTTTAIDAARPKVLFARTAGPYSSVVSSSQVCWFDPSLLDGSWRIEPAIWGTVEVEVALPILLAARRTRIVGLVVGGGFHTVLALAGNVPFTALAFAFYVAFLPLDTPSACAPSASADPNDPARPAVHTVWDLGPPRWVARWPWPCSSAPGLVGLP